MKNKNKIAFLFPGQGSQFIGMGRDLYDNDIDAKLVFDEVDETLNQKLSHMIFDGDIAELTMTSNTQPAIMATSMAALTVFLKYAGFKNINDVCSIGAGHSLGEYSALCGAQSITLRDTAALLRIRGDAMQNAVPQGLGGMVALLGADTEKATAVCVEAAKLVNEENGINTTICQIANDNGAEQIVLSGHMKAIDKVVEIASNYGIKRAIKLPVSAPFHSSLINTAEIIMDNAISKINIKTPLIPIIANYTALINTDGKQIKSLLVNQIANTVRWKETMHLLIKLGYETFIEFGPGKVLTTLINREFNNANNNAQQIQTFNICSIQEAEDCLTKIN